MAATARLPSSILTPASRDPTCFLGRKQSVYRAERPLSSGRFDSASRSPQPLAPAEKLPLGKLACPRRKCRVEVGFYGGASRPDHGATIPADARRRPRL